VANSIRECRGRVGHGFARVSSRNAFRMEFDDGTPFYPIGVQTGGVFSAVTDGAEVRGKARPVTAEEWAAEPEAADCPRSELPVG
jgi:hypothetical protein